MWSGGESLELGQGQVSGQVGTEAERLQAEQAQSRPMYMYFCLYIFALGQSLNT